MSEALARSRVAVVTGAPGAGKSAACAAFLELGSEYVAFDIDWLTVSASALARRDIISDQSTWPAYGRVWFEVLHSVVRNGGVPVLFTPHDRRDIDSIGALEWCRLEWLLLDCADAIRRVRLGSRPGWTDAMIDDAINDARYLRATIERSLDTTDRTTLEVAEAILGWLDTTQAQQPTSSD